MTDSAAGQSTVADTKVDARVFGLLLKGQLTETSSIADDSGGPAILLADHPRYCKLLRLMRMGRSTNLLRDGTAWANREPSWTGDLKNEPFWQLLFRIYSEHATGFLTVIDGSKSKVIAFSAGLALTINSKIGDEQLGAIMLRDEVITPAQAQHAADASRKSGQPAGWGLLKLGLLSVDEITELLERQGRERMYEIFGWRRGHVAFYPDERATQLTPVINLPLLAIMRNGFAWKNLVTVSLVERLTAPLFERTEPFHLAKDLGTLEFSLEGWEGAVVNAAREEQTPSEVDELFREADRKERARGLFGLYIFNQMGVIQLAAAEQPALPRVADLTGDAAPTSDEEADLLDIASAIESEAAVEPTRKDAATVEKIRDAQERGELLRPKTGFGNQLEEYRLQMALDGEGRELMRASQWEQARLKFEQLVQRQDKPIDALAYLSLATLLSRGPGHDEKARDLAKAAIEADNGAAIAHVAMSRALEELGKEKAAEGHRRKALALSQHNDGFAAEIKSVLELGYDAARAKKRKKAEEKEKAATKTMSTQDLIPWAFALVVLIALFLTSNLNELGITEYFYRPTDTFFWIRRGGLLVAGLIGFYLVNRRNPFVLFKELGRGFNGGLLLFALVVAGVVGFLSPVQRVEPVFVIVAGLTLFHVLAEEIFFRGFFTSFLLDRVLEKRLAVFLGALLFGVYHFTYYSFWYESDLMPRIYFTAAIIIFAGLPYSWLYYKTRGLLIPVVCHLGVNLTMMARSTSAWY